MAFTIATITRIWFPVITTAICLNCYGQEIGTIKIKKPEAIQITALDSKSQTLYRGIENRVKTSSALKNSNNQWSIQINYPNEISEYPQNDSVFKIMAKSISTKDSVSLMVSLFDKSSLDTICRIEKKFRIRSISDPIAVVNSKYKGYIDRNVLLLSKGITVILPGCDFEWGYTAFKVNSFEMIINNKGIEKTFSKSGVFTEEMIKNISCAPNGSNIKFINISALGPDGSVRQLNNISFKIN